MTGALVAGLLAGHGIAIPVGAVAAYLVVLTARTSWRVGAAAALGVATVNGGYALLAVLGGSALGQAVEPVAQPLRRLSAAVLLVLAVQVARSGARAYRRPGEEVPDAERLAAGRAYRRLVAVTAVNPTTVVYFVALVAGGVSGAGSTVGRRLAFFAAATAASASWQLVLVGGGALLGRTLTGRRGRLVTALTSSAIVIFLAYRSATVHAHGGP